ncbi:hypothetical protein Q9L58_005492 [Maublancomyces gigas]|uniref:Uncharacterized protein n=1 Tax=Discina gigas TaxID=1032678 RepID=A0ABR3GJ41_9PEZI
MKWDSVADQHLLLAILSAHKVNVDHNRVAQIVGCTPRACEERIKKLRKLAKECGYELKTSTPLASEKKGRKCNKDGKGKGKFIDNEDMILYRKGIVSDDPDVKTEDGMKIKGEIIKRESSMGSYDGYEYGDAKPFTERHMEDSAFSFAANQGTRYSNTPHMSAATGVGIPFGVPLEISRESLSPSCRQGGTAFGFGSRGEVPLKRGIPGYQNHHHSSRKTRSPKTGYSARDQEPVEFVEISPASKKDPIIIDDDEDSRDEDYDV